MITASKSALCRPESQISITDVAGVKVGHVTLVAGENIRTGVTAIIPHGGNVFQEKVPAAVFVAKGFGKLAGSSSLPSVVFGRLFVHFKCPGSTYGRESLRNYAGYERITAY